MTKPVSAKTILRGIRDSNKGNVAIMTAILTPVILLAALGGVNVTMAYSKRQELRNIAELACSQAIKPLRMKVLEDSERTTRAKKNFDQIAADRKLAILNRTVTSDWLTAHIAATAKIQPFIKTNMTSGGDSGFTTSVDITCNGLPPFPKVGDVILSSNFLKPDGEILPMKYGSWGIYRPSEFGWDGDGLNNSGVQSYGVEIQDWEKMGQLAWLPPGSTNKYVVEMDSDNGYGNAGNSNMYKIVELHRGIYRFSFWYYGRSSNPETNIIAVYLEGKRPVGPKTKMLQAKGSNTEGWRYLSFDIRVETYSLYKLWLAAEGIDDSYGGIINDLKLEYIRRPSEMWW